MSLPHAALGDVAEFINGFAFKPADWEPVGRPIIRIQNLTKSSNVLNRTTKRVPEKYHVTAGELLVSWSASLGVFEHEGEDALVNQHIFRVKEDSGKVVRSYLRHMIDCSIASMENIAHGSTMKHINRREFLDHKIPLPPLDEQRRIAGILDAADALRRRRREALALLDTLPGAIFAEMFLSSRPGEAERPSQPLTVLVDAVSGSTPSKENKAFWDGDIPWISPKDMKTDDLNRAILNITQEATKTGKAKLVGPDVTLIVIRGMILAHSVPICDLRVPASFNQDVKALIPRKGVSNIFISAALRASKNRLLSMVSNAAHGTKRIEMGDLMKFPIPAATEAEQQKFVNAIAGVAAQRSRFEGASHLAETLFASLQSRAFAGEL